MTGMGFQFTVETNHKPLIPLSATRQDATLHPMLQTVSHEVQSKSHPCCKQEPDHSRCPVKSTSWWPRLHRCWHHWQYSSLPQTNHQDSASHYLQAAGDLRSTESRQHFPQSRQHRIQGWPVYIPESSLLKQYWLNCEHSTIVDDLLLFNDCQMLETEHPQPSSWRVNTRGS